jgi:DNA (cytosine-5)-methyltransferase 1
VRGLDLFSGIGVASLAMQAAGIEVVAHAEIEPFPCRVLKHRFPGVPNLGDVAKITAEDLEPLGTIDVVSFGSPCQDWSVAGKRLGLKGHRSSLFHEAIRIIRLAKPRWAIFENVPGLFSSAGGWDFAAVLDEMAESGALDISWRVLDAQWFGVPQRRRRIFLVADFRGERAGEILSISEGVFRHPAPSREAGEEATRSLEPSVASTLGGGAGQRGWADDTDRMTFIPSVAPDSRSNPYSDHIGDESRLIPETSFALNANERWDGESETFIPTHVQGGGEQDQFVTPEGTSPTLAHSSNSHGGHHQPKVMEPTGFYANSGYKEDPVSGASAPLKGGKENAGQAAIAFQQNQRDEVRMMGGDGSVAGAIPAEPGMKQQNYVAQAVYPTLSANQSGGGAGEVHLHPQAVQETHPTLAAGTGGPGSQDYEQHAAVISGMAVRRLTPLECERLQGVPDGWTDIPEASDSTRYRALGNAWAYPVGAWVMKGIAGVER